jgi:hypothetical protein
MKLRNRLAALGTSVRIGRSYQPSVMKAVSRDVPEWQTPLPTSHSSTDEPERQLAAQVNNRVDVQKSAGPQSELASPSALQYAGTG